MNNRCRKNKLFSLRYWACLEVENEILKQLKWLVRCLCFPLNKTALCFSSSNHPSPPPPPSASPSPSAPSSTSTPSPPTSDKPSSSSATPQSSRTPTACSAPTTCRRPVSPTAARGRRWSSRSWRATCCCTTRRSSTALKVRPRRQRYGKCHSYRRFGSLTMCHKYC